MIIKINIDEEELKEAVSRGAVNEIRRDLRKTVTAEIEPYIKKQALKVVEGYPTKKLIEREFERFWERSIRGYLDNCIRWWNNPKCDEKGMAVMNMLHDYVYTSISKIKNGETDELMIKTIAEIIAHSYRMSNARTKALAEALKELTKEESKQYDLEKE